MWKLDNLFSALESSCCADNTASALWAVHDKKSLMSKRLSLSKTPVGQQHPAVYPPPSGYMCAGAIYLPSKPRQAHHAN